MPCQLTDNSSLQNFHIWGDNVKLNPRARVSYLRRVYLEVNGTTYSLGQDRAFTINGESTPTPFSDWNVDVDSDSHYIVSVKFSLTLKRSGHYLCNCLAMYTYLIQLPFNFFVQVLLISY